MSTSEVERLRARVAELEAAHASASAFERRTSEALLAKVAELEAQVEVREAQRAFQCERADAAERHVERAMKDGAAAVAGWTKTGKDLEAARARLATLEATPPLDRAVEHPSMPLRRVAAEVVALDQRPHPDAETSAAEYLDHIETLAADEMPLDEPWEDVSSDRDRCKWIAAMALAGMLACDDAKGDAK